jgi:hypothetical protein
MDFHDRVWDFFDEHRSEITRRLSDGGDQIAEADRLEGMLRSTFPEVPTDTNHQHLARMLVREVIAAMGERGVSAPIHVTVVTDSTVTIQQPRIIAKPKRRDAKKQTLKFLFIQDDALRLTDRVLFSYLCRLDKLKVKRPSTKRLRRFTGYRAATIQKALRTLTGAGYIDAHRKPLKSFKGLLVARNGDDSEVVRNVVRVNVSRGRVIRSGWAIKAFGISRATYFRYMGG